MHRRTAAPTPRLTPLRPIQYRRVFIVSLSQTIEQWFSEAQAVAQLVAPMAAFLGFIALGIMYMGSSFPIIGQWKQDNPRAANQVVMGLIFVIAASTVASLISF
jgi:hypothetical protein